MEAANMSPMMHHNRVMALIRNAICFLLCENVDNGGKKWTGEILFLCRVLKVSEQSLMDAFCHLDEFLICQKSPPVRKLIGFSITLFFRACSKFIVYNL